MSNNTKVWLHGLFAGAIGSFSTAAGGVLTMPGVFNFSHDGLIDVAKITLIPALLTIFAYLKQSPLPALNVQASSASRSGSQVPQG
jgi:hypothetical protein